MIQIIGYTALSLNLISMSMKNIRYLRAFGLVANAVYVAYGILIDAPPVYIGCDIAVGLHTYRTIETMNKKNKKMEKQDRTNAPTKIRNVYLSDLHKILLIYGNKPLTSDFGLPLALIEDNNEIIGYAFVAFNSFHKPEIKTLFQPGFEAEETKQLLTEHANNVFSSICAPDENDFTRLEKYREYFMDWLNLSNEQTNKTTTSYKPFTEKPLLKITKLSLRPQDQH